MNKTITTIYDNPRVLPKVVNHFELNKGDYLYFAYDADKEIIETKIPIIPNSVGYSYNPNFVSSNVLGRLSPIYSYISGSDEMYSFTLSLHRDMFKESLEDVVDRIKMLSYPKLTKGIVDYPKIYFSLGEFSSYVIVDTSISWKKPIIDGHYALVDIGFNIRVVRPLELPTLNYIEEEQTSDENAVYMNKLYSAVATQQDKDYLDYLKTRGYETSIIDFVTVGRDDKILQSMDYQKAVRQRDVQVERLTNLFNVISNIDSTGKADTLLKWMDNPELSTKEGNLRIKHNGEWLSIKKLKKNIDSYLDAYDASTGYLTSKEKEKIKQELYDILILVEKYEEEVLGYAANS